MDRVQSHPTFTPPTALSDDVMALDFSDFHAIHVPCSRRFAALTKHIIRDFKFITVTHHILYTRSSSLQ